MSVRVRDVLFFITFDQVFRGRRALRPEADVRAGKDEYGRGSEFHAQQPRRSVHFTYHSLNSRVRIGHERKRRVKKVLLECTILRGTAAGLCGITIRLMYR
jgi:hypothetical protein